nr:hypothetical protein [Bradyrhizobium sp. SZCCHNRI1029]
MTVYSEIPRKISFKFFGPKTTIRFRKTGVKGAPMPEASINKYGYSATRKNEIWFAEKAGIPPPTYYVALTKQLDELNLGRQVSFTFDS